MCRLRGTAALLLVASITMLTINRVAAQPGTARPPSQENGQQNGQQSDQQSGQRSELAKLAKQIEPDCVGRAERLPQYVDFFREKLGNDTRLFAFDVAAVVTESEQVRLQGHVEFPQTRTGLIQFLQTLGFDVSGAGLETLPDPGLGKRAFGLVQTTHTLSYSQANEPRSVVTDCLLGERLYLLREVGDHLLAHSGEGYLGYIAAADVCRVDAAAFAKYPTDSSVRVVVDHRLDQGFVLPAGAVLKRLAVEGETLLCELPSGETVAIPAAVCLPTKLPHLEIERAISVGKQMLGTAYHWGGKTSAGIDCSGLVQVAMATAAVQLPRDSNQQFLLGQLSGTRWHRAGMRRGDTLYFLGLHGRIRHTALYLGGDRYLQAEMPVVNIRSLNPEHEDYDARRATSFAFGKRVWQ